MSKKYIIFLIAVFTMHEAAFAFAVVSQGGASAFALGSQVDTSAIAEHAFLRNSSFPERISNPALYGSAFKTSLSSLNFEYRYMHQGEAFIQQKGDGFMVAEVSADSYLHLSGNDTFWGAASYHTGTKKHVRWNSSSDYELLFPYILADSTGGNLRSEQYCFSGGYVHTTGKMSMGADFYFRSLHEYRKIDPRPRNIISDLKAKTGAALSVGNRSLAAELGVIIYKQNGSVDFYNEQGVIEEYEMTGLGTYYSRFSGSKNSLYNKGIGWNASLSLVPSAKEGGAYLLLSLSRERYERIAESFNSLPLTKLFKNNYSMRAGWRHSSANYFGVCDIYATFKCNNRKGVENIAGNASSSEYSVIAHLTMFKYRNTTESASFNLSFDKWFFSAECGYADVCSKYVFPEREISFSKIYGNADCQRIIPVGKFTQIDMRLSAGLYSNVKNNMIFPLADMESSFIKMIEKSYKYFTADYTLISLSCRMDYRRTNWKTGFYVAMCGREILCSTNKSMFDVMASVGITF